MIRLTVAALCVLLAACAGTVRPQPVAGVDGDALRQRLGAATTVVASLLIQTVPEQGEPEVFTLRLWSTADRAVRVRAQKLDVAILDALVQPDGSYQAVLLREHVATSGRLGAADDPLLLRDLGLLLDELREGPAPAVATGGWTAELEAGPDGLPAAKILRAGGEQVRRLDYRRWQDFDGLLRPSQVELRIPGETMVTRLRVKSLDDPGSISPERMALTVPSDAASVTPAEFAKRMP